MPAIPAGQLRLVEAIVAQRMGKQKELHLLPWFIGLLMGVVISQMFSYWRYVRTDRKYMVAMLLTGVAATTAASVVLLLWSQHLWVWNFGRYLPFTETEWLARYLYINTCVTLLIQVLYIDRASRIMRHWWPAALISPFALGGFGAQLAFIQTALVNFDADYLSPENFRASHSETMTYIFLSCNVTTDVLITAIIVYGLYRIRTGWKHTDSLLKRLMVLSFESQVPALIIAIFSFVFWTALFEIALTFVMISTKTYILGLLITLNLRSAITGDSSNGGLNVSYPSTGRTKEYTSNGSNPLSSGGKLARGGLSSQGTASTVTITAQADAKELSNSTEDAHAEKIDFGSWTGDEDHYGSKSTLTPSPRAKGRAGAREYEGSV